MTLVVLVVEALMAVAVYVTATQRVTGWPARRTALFVIGMGLFVIVLALPDERLPMHMAEHLALALVVAPLLVAGSPIALALRVAPVLARRTLRWPAVGHPLVGWAALCTIMVVAHVPAVWGATDAGVGHVAAHAIWLGSAALFWRPFIGVDPVPHRPRLVGRLLLLLTAMAPMGAVGSSMVGATSPWYAGTTLAQTHDAGAIMWVGGGTAMVLATVALAWAALVQEHRRRLRVEEALW